MIHKEHSYQLEDKQVSPIDTSQSLHKKALRASLYVHGIFLGIILLLAVFRNIPWLKKVHVFDIVDCPQGLSEKATLPKPSKVPNVTFKQLPEPKTPKSVNTPKPVEKSAKPKPQKSTQPSKITYDQFLKQQSHSVPSKKKPQASTAHVDTFKATLKNKLGAPTGNVSPNAINSYIHQIKQKIERVWEKPSDHSISDCQAVVEFTINAQGRLLRFRIINSSGNDMFDQSIKKAFSSITFFGNPPEAKEYTFRLTFKADTLSGIN